MYILYYHHLIPCSFLTFCPHSPHPWTSSFSSFPPPPPLPPPLTSSSSSSSHPHLAPQLQTLALTSSFSSSRSQATPLPPPPQAPPLPPSSFSSSRSLATLPPPLQPLPLPFSSFSSHPELRGLQRLRRRLGPLLYASLTTCHLARGWLSVFQGRLTLLLIWCLLQPCLPTWRASFAFWRAWGPRVRLRLPGRMVVAVVNLNGYR